MFIQNALLRHPPATQIPFTGVCENFTRTNQKKILNQEELY